MQKQTTQLTSKQWVDQMLREHYEKARQAKAEDGWCVGAPPLPPRNC